MQSCQLFKNSMGEFACNNICRNFKFAAFCCVYFLVCLRFFIPLKNFSLIWRHHYYRWRVANFDLCSHWAVRVLKCATLTVTLGICLRTLNTHTFCQAYGSGTVTTCFNDLGMSSMGFEHPTRLHLWGECSNPLCLCCGSTELKEGESVIRYMYTCTMFICWMHLSCVVFSQLCSEENLEACCQVWNRETERQTRHVCFTSGCCCGISCK